MTGERSDLELALRLADSADEVTTAAFRRADLLVETKADRTPVTEADREVEGGVETVEASLPAVLTAQKGLNEPRYPSLPGIMRAKRQEIKYLDLASLGIGREELENPLKRVSLAYPSMERKGRMLAGDIGESAKELAEFIRHAV